MANPNTLRTAAYLSTRERLDSRRRTSGRVQCVAPNRVCGARCIPPEWDCRIKGEGNDPHLKAVGKGSDPVAGLASIERGFQRIGKGVTKLSFSEIEGGRRSLARGTAKLAPGDLKKKEDLKKKVDAFLGRVLLPATAIVGAGLLHKGMKNFRGYREGPGRQVDDAARSAINLVRTNIPGYGAQVRARQQAGPAAARATNQAAVNLEARGPSRVTPSASGRPVTRTVNSITPNTDVDLVNSLNNALNQADGRITSRRGRPIEQSFSEWEDRSLNSFWGLQRNAKITPGALDRVNGSAFTVHATNTLLSESFSLPAPTGRRLKLDSENTIRGITSYLKDTGSALRTSMKEFGVDVSDARQVEAFIKRTQSSDIDKNAFEVLQNAVSKTDYRSQAEKLYKETATGYDTLFAGVLNDVQQARTKHPNESFYNDALQAHAAYLNRRMQLPEPVHGSYTALLTRRAYYNRYVAGSRQLPSNRQINLSLTPTEAVNAGVEVARSRSIPEPETAAAALDILRRYYGQGDNALGSIQLVRATRQPGRARDRSNQPRRELTFGQRVAAYMRQRNPDGSPVYATREAAEAAARRVEERRRRRDARVDAYLLVRNDFTPSSDRRGKPCGKSFVPKDANCTQPTTARYVEEPKPEKKEGLGSKVGKAALAAGAVAGGVAAFRNRRAIAGGVRAARSTIKSERAAYNVIKQRKLAEKNAYGRQKYSPQAASRAARQEYIQTRQRELAPKLAEMAIQKLSTKEMYDGLDKLPKRFQPQARELVGKAKTVAARIGLESSGMEMVSVNNQNNFATYRATDGSGSIASVGSVGDSLLIYNSQKKGEIQGVGRYGMAFTVDRQFDQRKSLNAEQARGISSTTRAMFEEQKAQLPDNAFVFNIAYKDDGLGRKRAAIYKRMGFRQLPKGNEMWAIKDQGKFRKLTDDELEALMRILQGRKDAADSPTKLRAAAYLHVKKKLTLAAA